MGKSGPETVFHAGYAIRFMGFKRSSSLPRSLIALAEVNPSIRGNHDDYLLAVGSSEDDAWELVVESAKAYIDSNLGSTP